MRHLWPAAGALALLCVPGAAQDAPPPSAPAAVAAAGIEQAAFCAALKTFLSAINARSSSPDPVMQERLKESAVRWLAYATTLPPQDQEAVMARYAAQSQQLTVSFGESLADPSGFAEGIGTDLRQCAAAERAIFGNDFRDR